MDTIIGAAASPANDLVIPVAMQPIMLYVKTIATGLFCLFFFAEALRLQAAAVTHAMDAGSRKPSFAGFLWRSAKIFAVITFLYQWMFLKIVSLADFIAMSIGDQEAWVSLIETVKQNTNATIPFMHITFPTLVGAGALTLLQIIQDVFVKIRFVILCLLYAFGPIAWACGISKLGTGVIRSWFKNTWEVSWWLVIFSLVKAAIVPMGLNALSSGLVDGATSAIVDGGVVLIMVFMIPALTAALFSEANLGAVSSAAMGAVTAYSAMGASKMGTMMSQSGLPAGKALLGAAAAGVSAYRSPDFKRDESGMVKGPTTKAGLAATAVLQNLKDSWKERTR